VAGKVAQIAQTVSRYTASGQVKLGLFLALAGKNWVRLGLIGFDWV
jgi:hypothetical protein